MKQLDFYKWTTLVLLLINLSVLGFAFFRPPPPHSQGPPPKHGGATSILNFDATQSVTYEELKEGHKSAMRQLNKKSDELLSLYFKDLNDNVSSEDKDSLLLEIQQVMAARVDTTYGHLSAIKALCTEEQKQHFPNVLDQLLRNILKTRKKPHPPRRMH